MAITNLPAQLKSTDFSNTYGQHELKPIARWLQKIGITSSSSSSEKARQQGAYNRSGRAKQSHIPRTDWEYNHGMWTWEYDDGSKSTPRSAFVMDLEDTEKGGYNENYQSTSSALKPESKFIQSERARLRAKKPLGSINVNAAPKLITGGFDRNKMQPDTGVGPITIPQAELPKLSANINVATPQSLVINPNYNKKLTRLWLRQLGINPYDLTGAERRLIRLQLNNPIDLSTPTVLEIPTLNLATTPEPKMELPKGGYANYLTLQLINQSPSYLKKGSKLIKKEEVCPKCGKVHSAKVGCSIAKFKLEKCGGKMKKKN